MRIALERRAYLSKLQIREIARVSALHLFPEEKRYNSIMDYIASYYLREEEGRSLYVIKGSDEQIGGVGAVDSLNRVSIFRLCAFHPRLERKGWGHKLLCRVIRDNKNALPIFSKTANPKMVRLLVKYDFHWLKEPLFPPMQPLLEEYKRTENISFTGHYIPYKTLESHLWMPAIQKGDPKIDTWIRKVKSSPKDRVIFFYQEQANGKECISNKSGC